jgi:hypothetical protein
MTIDSRYESQPKARDKEVEYPFRHESIGEEAIKVYLIKADGTRVLLTREGATEYVTN